MLYFVYERSLKRTIFSKEHLNVCVLKLPCDVMPKPCVKLPGSCPGSLGFARKLQKVL